jgi:hypothetical protein
VCTLFRNGYFNRLWVIQEIFLSSHKRVLCGGIWLDLDDLVHTLEGVSPYRGSANLRLPSVDFVNFMLLGEHDLTSIKRGQATLWHCISSFSAYSCQDPRDKIYGLLGLVREDDKLEVDYSKSTEDLFLQVVMFIGSRALSKYDADVMLLLSDAMELHQYREVHKEFLEELSKYWMDGILKKIEVGFERRRHQKIADCGSRHHAERGCCSDRWWFLCDGVKHYRDQSSYQEKGPYRYLHRRGAAGYLDKIRS